MTYSVLNGKVLNGLRAQYNASKVNAILTQATAMALHAEYQSGNRTSNKPEPYELYEAGWIDRALDYLGFGRWATGRPKLGRNSNHNSKPIPRARAITKTVTLEPEPQPTTQPRFPRLSEIFTAHLPSQFPQPRNFADNAIEFRNILVIGGQGSGKTTTLETLAEITAKTYGHSQVRAYMQPPGLTSC